MKSLVNHDNVQEEKEVKVVVTGKFPALHARSLARSDTDYQVLHFRSSQLVPNLSERMIN
ncbi:hypothetical protein KIN20_035267 [Parelaphostrongylus tenuis]|uniref:Uncharacterized protein n=1 Tax=Parelaphostrongylus tenuis TaxID=148309 RepID=A0AAD5RB65_PARTN|nr:hypothetical protein KIN20_035267 [Parelaphostrongylus tenuis]